MAVQKSQKSKSKKHSTKNAFFKRLNLDLLKKNTCVKTISIRNKDSLNFLI